MTIDAQTQAILDQGKDGPELHELPLEDARNALKGMTAALDIAKTEVHKRIERTIPGPNGNIPIRIYWPKEITAGETLPVLILYHGGGFYLGDMDTHENIARYYSTNANVIVVNVDYRLAPEHVFPAAIEDAYTALEWVAENIETLGGNRDRIAVTGDSAGGNISAVITQLAKKRTGPSIFYQILLYPVVNMNVEVEYASRDTYGSGAYLLSKASIVWVNNTYFSHPEDANSTMASPILEKDLSGLPPALIITAGYDPLVDEGKHYADRLREAGVPVEYRCFESTIHGFMSFAGAIDAGRTGLDLVVKTIKEKLHSS